MESVFEWPTLLSPFIRLHTSNIYWFLSGWEERNRGQVVAFLATLGIHQLLPINGLEAQQTQIKPPRGQ